MRPVEGRVLDGLDEFMLRSGHLAVLCQAALDAGGSWPRIQRAAAAILGKSVPIEDSENSATARYLAAKSLCRIVQPIKGRVIEQPSPAYPDLEVYELEPNEWSVRAVGAAPVEVCWQDTKLADPAVPSRVGAISWVAKTGSKTGLSHVCDWAQFLELIDSSGQIAPIGRLLTTPSEGVVDGVLPNPYLPSSRRVIFGYQYLLKDFDIFARLAPKLLTAATPLTKATSRRLFVESLLECADDAEKSPALTSSRQFGLMQQVRDLERASRNSRKELGETSTAWHRAASRVEALTDLGLLRKDSKAEDDKYKYVYYPTPALDLAVDRLNHAEPAEQWVEDHLVDMLGAAEELEGNKPNSLELINDLSDIASSLRLPTTQFPIDCLSLGVAVRDATRMRKRSLSQIRTQIESLPREFQDATRLARGREGSRAEYISLDLRKLAGIVNE